MSSATSVSIVVPAYNEENVIRDTLTGLLEHLQEGWELIVVNDGSTDKTGAVIDEFKHPQLTVLAHPYCKGYGAALKTGIRNSEGEIIVFFDADGQHSPEDIARLLKLIIDHGYEMVVGARDGAHDVAMRKWGKRLLTCVANYLAGYRIPDLNSGLRAVRRDLLFSFLSILPNGFSLTTTITLACIQSGYSLGYVPIKIKKRVGESTLQLSDGIQSFLLIARLIMLFSPLKIFGPASIAIFLISLPLLVIDLRDVNITDGTILLILTGWITCAIGLLADQIAAVRRELGQRWEKRS